MRGRRRQSPLEALFEGYAALPPWASIVGAIASYLVFTYVPGMLAGTSMSGRVFATMFTALAPWVAGFVLLAGLVGVARRWWRRRLLSRTTGLDSIRSLSWHDLELLVGEAYRRQGYTVVERGGPQPDGGIDLELEREGRRVIVQCKQWTRPVPVEKARELLGAVTGSRADRGVLVAPGGFTQAALDFAKRQPLELLGAEELLKLATHSAPVVPLSPVAPTVPGCPTCGKPMVQRTARKGPSAGSSFWGCAGYPACRGTRAA